jgi:hypothetical protein
MVVPVALEPAGSTDESLVVIEEAGQDVEVDDSPSRLRHEAHDLGDRRSIVISMLSSPPRTTTTSPPWGGSGRRWERSSSMTRNLVRPGGRQNSRLPICGQTSYEEGPVAVRRQRAMVVVTMAKPKARSSMGAQTMRGPRISAGS